MPKGSSGTSIACRYAGRLPRDTSTCHIQETPVKETRLLTASNVIHSRGFFKRVNEGTSKGLTTLIRFPTRQATRVFMGVKGFAPGYDRECCMSRLWATELKRLSLTIAKNNVIQFPTMVAPAFVPMAVAA